MYMLCIVRYVCTFVSLSYLYNHIFSSVLYLIYFYNISTTHPCEWDWEPFEGTPREVRQMNQSVAAPPPLDSDSDDSILQEPPRGLRNVRRRLNNDNRRVQMCGFINGEGTGIRSAAHAAALIGVLQLARSARGGIAASLGHSNVSSTVCI